MIEIFLPCRLSYLSINLVGGTKCGYAVLTICARILQKAVEKFETELRLTLLLSLLSPWNVFLEI